MNIPLFHINAFTAEPFQGNPAGVCLLDRPAKEKWMQLVAREMNLPETAFLYPQDGIYHLRWFTPAVEVDLCGHATLASVHALWESGRLDENKTVSFQTKSGMLTATTDGKWIELNFPAEKADIARIDQTYLDALGVEPLFTGKNRMDYLIEIASEDVLRNLRPDFSLLKKMPSRGVIVTSRAQTKPFDFISRFFAPGIGIDEDPVTGSAHCCLAPYWQEKLHKDTFLAYQASERGGTVKASIQGDRVLLSGQAVTFFSAMLQNNER